MNDLEAIQEFAQFYARNQAAFDAACQSAIDAGALEPQGVGERMSAGILAANYQSFRNTARARQRVLEWAPGQAQQGAEAYVRGNWGNANAYTYFLINQFGLYPGTSQPPAPRASTSGCLVLALATGSTLLLGFLGAAHAFGFG